MSLTNQSKVFVDTSVLFAAISSLRGYARDLLLAGAAGQLQLFISDHVLEEATRNMALKRPTLLPIFEQFRPLLPQIVNPDPEQLEQARQFSALKDPDDAPIIAGALKAQAAYLATYDRKHLLAIKDKIQSAFGISVVTPQELFA